MKFSSYEDLQHYQDFPFLEIALLSINSDNDHKENCKQSKAILKEVSNSVSSLSKSIRYSTYTFRLIGRKKFMTSIR